MFISNFFEHFVRIFSNFWMSSITPSSSCAPSLGHTSATITSIKGTSNIFGDEPLSGTTTLTTASAMTSAVNETYSIQAYNMNVTQAYVESMDTNELNEFIGKLENIERNEKPKTLAKTINKNYKI